MTYLLIGWLTFARGFVFAAIFHMAGGEADEGLVCRKEPE